jgi:hypothetical protein
MTSVGRCAFAGAGAGGTDGTISDVFVITADLVAAAVMLSPASPTLATGERFIFAHCLCSHRG